MSKNSKPASAPIEKRLRRKDIGERKGLPVVKPVVELHLRYVYEDDSVDPRSVVDPPNVAVAVDMAGASIETADFVAGLIEHGILSEAMTFIGESAREVA